MKNHHIICGAGRVGSKVAMVFHSHKKDFIVLDRKEDEIKFMRKFGYKAMKGNATQEKFLKKADVEKALWIIASLGNDEANLKIMHHARELNPLIKVAARISDEENLNKFYKSGVDLVIMPELVGGLELANSIIGLGKKGRTVKKPRRKR